MVAEDGRRAARRRALVPPIRYPEHLPVVQRRADLLAAIRDHQVVVVAGETGSGKTTQLPKLCLELGRGVAGTIGHTQPRRIAARAVAERVAEELGVPLGGVVGYQVRFTDRVGRDTLVKLMTDGILLAEIQRDPLLRRYDTLILDEAHERSLNVDFLLGYLTRLLPRRPDLHVVITSATIDPQRFADHFGGAPVIEVSGRTYPVEVRYRPLTEPLAPDDDDETEPAVTRDQTQGIVDAVAELAREPAGDVLVFLSGEREIRDTTDVLRALALPRHRGAPFVRAAVGGRAAPRLQHPHRAPHRPGDERRRDLPDGARGSATSSTRAPRGSPVTATGSRSSGSRSSRCRRPPRGSAPAAAGGWPTACASGCTRRQTTTRARTTPSPRSCAPTSPRSSCGWRRCASARSRTSRSWTRRTVGRSPPACSCCRSSAHSSPAPTPASRG